MKKTLKLISLILAVFIILSALFACKSTDEPQNEEKKETDESTEKETESTETEENGKDGSILVFSSGEYKVKFIRSELANQNEKEAYNKIRELFKDRTKKSVPISTDFVSGNETLDNGAAILIGKTDYPESKQAHEPLKGHQATATVIGNKYVIAYASYEALEALLIKLEELIKKAPIINMTVTSAWNLDVTVTGVVDTTELPDYNGTAFDASVDAGQGSRVLVKKNTTQEQYTAYLTALSAAGFAPYTSHTLDGNLFHTYTNDKYIVHTMYFPSEKATRVAVDCRETFGLAGLKSENVYTNSEGKSTYFTQLGLAQIPGATANGMGYLVKLTDGRFVVVDGGYAYDSGGGGNSGDFILRTMKHLADDPNNIVIAAWFVTHIHTDHAGGFMGMGNKHANDVKIEKLIYNQPNDDQMASAGLGERLNWISTGIENFKKANNPIKTVIKAHPGQQFFFCDLTVTMIGTMDILEPYTLSSGNNSSLVMSFEMNGGKVLLTGDCEPAEGRAIRDIYGGIDSTTSCLKSDFVQLSHHGYGNTKTETNPDRSALNVMAAAGRDIYALIPVAYTKLEGDPGGYEDSVKNARQNDMFPEDKRIIAHDTNVTIEFKTDGTYVLGDGTYTKGEGWKTPAN